MQIYNIAKYQNISDRLKRLASFSKLTQPAEVVSPRMVSRAQPNYFSKNQTITDITYRPKYDQKQTQPRVYTQQAEEKPQQQSTTLISELINLRENRCNRTMSRQKIPKYGKAIENELQLMISQKEQRNTYRRLVQTKQTEDEEKPSLSKIKSQNSLKIDQILSNYNSYKQNKQQFLQTINKISNESHQRVISQNLKEYFEKDQKNQIQPKNKNKQQAFGEIENIWNQQLTEQDSAPKFQRSKPEIKDRFAQLTQILNNQLQQKPEVETKVDNLVRGKLIFKRLEIEKKENDEIQQQLKRNLVMSPRGLRVPGKICKNNDKSFGVLPKYK